MAVWNKGALPEQGAKPNSLNLSDAVLCHPTETMHCLGLIYSRQWRFFLSNPFSLQFQLGVDQLGALLCGGLQFLYPHMTNASVGISSWWMSPRPMKSSSLYANQIVWRSRFSPFAYCRIKDKHGVLLAWGFLYDGVSFSQNPVLSTPTNRKVVITSWRAQILAVLLALLRCRWC